MATGQPCKGALQMQEQVPWRGPEENSNTAIDMAPRQADETEGPLFLVINTNIVACAMVIIF